MQQQLCFYFLQIENPSQIQISQFYDLHIRELSISQIQSWISDLQKSLNLQIQLWIYFLQQKFGQTQLWFYDKQCV